MVGLRSDAGGETDPETPAADDPYAQYYVVKKGDSLSKIAAEFYGDKTLYPKIFEANRRPFSPA